MIVDTNIQSQPGWQFHLGGSIGGDPPKVFTLDQASSPPSATFFIQGCAKPNGWADGEAYLARPIPSGNSRLCFSYDITLDPDSLLYAQAVETDIIFTDQDNFNGNGSVQLDYSKGGQLQIAAQGGGWASTGHTPGKYTPNVPHHVQIFYVYDFVAKRLSTTGIAIDSVLYAIPIAMQGLVMKDAGWKNSMHAMVQLQSDLNQQAKQFMTTFNNVTLTWSAAV